MNAQYGRWQQVLGDSKNQGEGQGVWRFRPSPELSQGVGFSILAQSGCLTPGKPSLISRVFVLICKMEVTCCEDEQREFCKAMVTE